MSSRVASGQLGAIAITTEMYLTNRIFTIHLVGVWLTERHGTFPASLSNLKRRVTICLSHCSRNRRKTDYDCRETFRVIRHFSMSDSFCRGTFRGRDSVAW